MTRAWLASRRVASQHPCATLVKSCNRVHVTASTCKACAGDHKKNGHKVVNVINPQSGKSEQRVFVPDAAQKDGSIEGQLFGGSTAEDDRERDVLHNAMPMFMYHACI